MSVKLVHVLPLLLVLLPVAGHAAPASKTSKEIEAAAKACISKSEGSDYKMKECLSKAYEAMDARMNTVYRRLMEKLGKTGSASLLRDAQRKWLSFREAEATFAYAVDPNQGGTAQGVASVDLAYTMVKERTTALENYLDSVLENGDR